MKTLYKLLTVLLLPSVLILFSYSSGSPGGKTGSMGDGGTTCTQCHNDGTAVAEVGWITTNIPSDGYTAGETYAITVTGTSNGVVKMGYEVTAENSSGMKEGTWTITDDARTKLANSNNSVTHKSGGNTPNGNTNTWTANWTAPMAGMGDITFNSAVNAANGNGNTSGDQIYTTFETFAEAVISDISDELAASIKMYPNPAQNYLNIELPEESSYRVVSINGAQMTSFIDASNNNNIDISDYKTGIYFVQIISGENSITKKFVKN